VHILITGAASGIGRELTFCFAHEKEAILSLVDINERGLNDVVTRVQVNANAYTLDLANVDAVPVVDFKGKS
jgi:NAD(P)-dependent dehydrogenase (short-subunit alcohol dehydrogenase family)